MTSGKYKKWVEKIRLEFFFTAAFLVIGILAGSLLFLYNRSLDIERLSLETLFDLSAITETKAKKIDEYLLQVKADIEVLAESDEVKELLKGELVVSETAIIADVNYHGKIIAKEVENYIRAHPGMTLEDLQDSKEFHDIIVQSIGKRGYSAASDAEDLVTYFHKNPEIVGLELRIFAKRFPALLGYLEKAGGDEGVSEGFYNWQDPDGKERRKYGKFIALPIQTADSINLTLGTTAYLDEYKEGAAILSGIIHYLKNFKDDHDYSNIIIISPDGYVSYMVRQDKGFGGNLQWPERLKGGLSKSYILAKKNNEPSLFGPFIEAYGDIYPNVSSAAPVYERGFLLGYVALVDEMDNIFQISEERTDLSETKESYLVDSKNFLISPTLRKEVDIFVQSVDSENIKGCFLEDVKDHSIHDRLNPSLDYRGDAVLGVHRAILSINWCLLTEISYEEAVTTPLRKGTGSRVAISISLVFAMAFLGFFTGRFLSKRKDV